MKKQPDLKETPAFATSFFGNIRCWDKMGTDKDIVAAARVSFDDKGNSTDEKLIRYLIEHDHGTPFEMATIRFRVNCPIFIARQWFRHRMGSFNEISGRYTKLDPHFYQPATWRRQATRNKQASLDETIESPALDEEVKIAYNAAVTAYQSLIEAGVAREQARMVLPLATETKFIWQVNARSLMNFLLLRCAPDAQWEIQAFAKHIRRTYFREWLPLTYKAFMDKHNLEEEHYV